MPRIYKVQPVFEELDKVIANSSVKLRTRMKPRLTEINKGLNGNQLHMLCVLYSNDPDKIYWLQNKVVEKEAGDITRVGNLEVISDFTNWNNAFRKTDTYPRTSIVALFFDDSAKEIPELFQHVKKLCEDIPVVLAFTPEKDNTYIKQGLDPVLLPPLEIKYVLWDGKVDMENMLVSFLDASTREIFYSYSLTLLIADIKETLLMEMEEEEREMKAQRQRASQKISSLTTSANHFSTNTFTPVREKLQQQLAQFEYGLHTRLEKFFDTPGSGYWKKMEDTLEDFQSLNEKKAGRKSKLSIPPEIQEDFLQQANQLVRNHGMVDIKFMDDELDNVAREIEHFFTVNKTPFVPLSRRYITPENLDEVSRKIVRLEQVYRGEQKRQGGYEYFMAIRRYQMIFFMFLSTSGLSFWNKAKEFRPILIPVTFFLLGLGVFSVARNTQQDRRDFKEKELDRAKGVLKSEMRRIANEFMRSWKLSISSFIKQQFADLISQVETQQMNLSHSKGRELEEDRRKFQQILAGVESDERRLEGLQRQLNMWERNFARAVSDLRLAFQRQKRSS